MSIAQIQVEYSLSKLLETRSVQKYPIFLDLEYLHMHNKIS